MVYFGKMILKSPGSTVVAFGINKNGKNKVAMFISLVIFGSHRRRLQ